MYVDTVYQSTYNCCSQVRTVKVSQTSHTIETQDALIHDYCEDRRDVYRSQINTD